MLEVYLYDEAGKTLVTSLPISAFGATSLDPTILMVCTAAGRSWSWPSSGSMIFHRGANTAAPGAYGRRPVYSHPRRGSARQRAGLSGGGRRRLVRCAVREAAQGGAGSFKALQDWVKLGGQLVVCQPGDEADRGKIAAFADAGMLPVRMKDAQGSWLENFKSADKPDLELLYTMAVHRDVPMRPDRFITDRNWDLLLESKERFPMFLRSAQSGRGRGCMDQLGRNRGRTRIR